MNFTELGVPAPLVTALAKQQITEPMPCQTASWPVLLAGRDAYVNAETGTGKTLAYLLPLYARLDLKLEGVQVVVIAPTHELAIQIQRQCCDLAQNAGMAVRTVLLIGGTAPERQIEKLKKKPHVVVGSPGRIREMIERGRIKAHTIRAIVIDEADRLLMEESLVNIRAIVKAAPGRRQLIFVSATETEAAGREVNALSPQVEMLRVAEAPVNPDIEHLFLVCEERDKPDILRSLVHAMKPDRAIAFVHRNETAEKVAAKLAFHKIAAADLHGAFDKMERKKAMDDIRTGAAQVLIASDIAARGLDIAGITHIFNLDAPSQSKAYLHRVGRTGRAGAKGVAVSILTEPEMRLVRRYTQELGIALQHVRLREGRVIPADAAF